MCLPYLVGEQNVLVLHENGLNCVIELGVPDPRAVQAGEQVPNETQEERHVLKHKLGQIHVS